MRHYFFKTSMLSLSAAVVLGITGCSGGGSSDSTTPSTAISGGAVDGYLQSATVFVDENNDTIHGELEQTTTTDTNGDFTLTGTITNGTKIYAYGGIDRSTGKPFEGRLSAIYQGSAPILSPLSTYVTAMVAKGVDIETAKTKVAANFGLSAEDIDKDPMTEPTVFLAAQKVQKTVEVVAAATGGSDFNTAYEEVFASLASVTDETTATGDFNATILVQQVEVDQSITIDTSVETFLETYVAKVDEIVEQNATTDALDGIGNVLDTYTEIVEAAIENNDTTAIADYTTVVENLDANDTVTQIEDGTYTDPIADALDVIQSALDNNISYLGTNTADNNITANLQLTDPVTLTDVNLTWSSDNAAVDATTGVVTRADTVDVNAALKATVSKTASDGTVVTKNETYNLVVKRNEYAPVAANLSATVAEDANTTITLDATDQNLDTLTLTVGTPSHGTVTQSGVNVTYVPVANFNGTDSFTYSAVDSTGRVSNTATVNITVTPVNDAPVVTGETVAMQPSTSVIIDLLANDTDVDGDTLTVISFSQGTLGTVADLGNGNIQYAAGTIEGTDTITYTVSDGNGGDVNGIVNIVISQNQAPVASNATLTMVVGETVTGNIGAYDPEGTSVTYSVTNITSGFFGTGTDLSATGDYTIVAANEGTGTIEVTITDGDGISTVVTYTVNVVATQTSGDENLYNLSEAGTITSAEFDALSPITTPADIKLYSFWGTNTDENNVTTLEGDYLMFETGGTFVMDDGGLVTGTHNENYSGVINVLVDGMNVDFVMLDSNVTGTELETALPFVSGLNMPSSAVVYKTAVRMNQDVYDTWGEAAQDCSSGTCVPYTALVDMVDNNAHGIISYNRTNYTRVLVFDDNQSFASGSGTVVEVDVTDASNPLVVNPNAGTWTKELYTDGTDMIKVTVDDTLAAAYNKYPILIDAGATIDAIVTTTVTRGSFEPAGSSFIEYRFNDVAAAVIKNNFNPVTLSEWVTNVQGSYPDHNATEYDAATAIVNPESVSPLYELEIEFNGQTYDRYLTEFALSGGTATISTYINGVYSAADSGSYGYTVASNEVTASENGTPVYAFKIVGTASTTELESLGLNIPESAAVYQVMGKQLVDNANYYDIASTYEANGTISATNYPDVPNFIQNASVVNLNGFTSRFDETTMNSFLLAFEDNSSTSYAVGTVGNLVEVNTTGGIYDYANPVYAGTWEIIDVNGDITVLVHPTNSAYDDRMCFGLDGNTVVQVGGIDRVNDVDTYYLADTIAKDVINTNFLNQSIPTTSISSDVVGVWQIGTTTSDFDYLALLANGTFILGEYDSTVTEPENGLEAGTYTYDGTTLTFNLTYDKNGPGINSGIGDIGTPVSMSASVSADGNTLTLGGNISFAKVDLSASTMYGVWVNGTVISDFSYLLVLPNSEFLYGEYDSTVVDPVAENGLEAGTYTYDGSNVTFNIIYDENAPGNDSGIGNIGTPVTIDASVSADGNTLSAAGGTLSWTRGL